MKAISTVAFCAGLALSAGALADDNWGVAQPLDAPTALKVNIADIVCSAAVNSTGSLAGGETVAASTRLGVGTYEVKFKAPCRSITAKNGWARIVQPDTLQTGTLANSTCVTADRAGVPDAVWVQCYGPTSAPRDTSFMLLVLR